ncbi:hypothetical protein AB4Y32_28630 [Paraburkholderia phymatum]|uniref:Uncharacterized protein n=1 Tax=Paraburkholderia phymatum TaxID=148447 RepID=A0ACC6U8B8_9BURK
MPLPLGSGIFIGGLKRYTKKQCCLSLHPYATIIQPLFRAQTMLKNFFTNTAPARTASTVHSHAGAFVITLIALFLAAFHRYEGFAEPYQVWFRLDEIQYLGRWAPGGIEHLFGAFALCALFTLFWGIFVKPTTRNRALLAGTFVVIYFVASTLLHDGRQYLASHDPSQLIQMLADVLGLGFAFFWLCWPEEGNDGGLKSA